MPLFLLRDLSLRFRGPALFEGVNSSIEPGERIGLLGRNGTGKTTLMRILAGQVIPDQGSVQSGPQTAVALLPQGVPAGISGTVEQVVRKGIRRIQAGDGVEQTQGENAPGEGWEADHRVARVLSQMELEPAAEVGQMSAGMVRRVLLAQALVDQPDLLLLDEPTNHLDIGAILWLEDFLLRWPATLMFVTHDRQFLKRLANRIWEIDSGRLFDWTCDYPTFLRRKEEALAAQEKQDALFDRRLAEEEVWIRQGIKARRTRNEGRVRRLEAMRTQRSERRQKTGVTGLRIQEGLRSGNLVTSVEDVSFAWPGRNGGLPILDGFSATVMRGDKVGVVGPNGSGKSTLLRILLGEIPPQKGTVRTGTNLQVAYFDQLRGQLDESRTIEENVADGAQSLAIDGKPRHIISYLQDFLFTADRARTPVRFLSGGERSRVLLAKLFSRPANVIVLDEPTNDLDAETMELLEERLVEYSGTLLVVSHDREFLNNVVTSTIAIEVRPDGQRVVGEFAGGYDDWQRQVAARIPKRAAADSARSGKGTEPARAAEKPESQGSAVPRRLSFREQRELDGLPGRIAELEKSIASLQLELGNSDFYRQPGEQIAAKNSQLRDLEAALEQSFGRWMELENRLD